MASLIGHSFGDGHIGKDNFTFTNNSKALLNEVINNVNLQKFFEKIKLILEEFGIRGVTITQCHLHEGRNGKTLQKRLRICGTFNFINFHNKINFTDFSKKKKLENMIRNTGNIRMRIGEADEKIIQTLKTNSQLNTLEIKKNLNVLSHWAILNHLKWLEKNGIVSRSSNHPKPHIWKLNK